MLKEMLVYCVLLDSCCACIMRRRHVCVAVLVLVFVVYNRQKERHFPKADPYDDVRENIINYDDEGGGEDDMTAFDITPLQIPIAPAIGNGGPLLGHASRTFGKTR